MDVLPADDIDDIELLRKAALLLQEDNKKLVRLLSESLMIPLSISDCTFAYEVPFESTSMRILYSV